MAASSKIELLLINGVSAKMPGCIFLFGLYLTHPVHQICDNLFPHNSWVIMMGSHENVEDLLH